MTTLAEEARVTLDLGLFGEVDSIVLYHSDPPRLTAVYVQFNGHLINTLPRLSPHGISEIWRVIQADLASADSLEADDLLSELSFGGTSD